MPGSHEHTVMCSWLQWNWGEVEVWEVEVWEVEVWEEVWEVVV